MPLPGVTDDIRQGSLRPPVQKFTGQLVIRNQHSRISRPPGLNDMSNVLAGNLLTGVNDFQNTVTPASAKIDRLSPGSVFDITQSRDMSLGKVRDVDIITNAGAIRCFIIITKTFK